MVTELNDRDAALLTAIAGGDKPAFELLYRTYASQLYKYIRKNIQRREDCEEIVQEIFESVWMRRAELKVKSSVAAYLIGMARYKIIRYFRTSTVRKKYIEHFLLFEAVYDQAEDGETNPSAIEVTLDKLIKDLPARCQQALKLRLSEDLSNGDIAKRMNISTRTVEAYMFRAFNHIRDSYSHYAGSASLIIVLMIYLFKK